MLRVCQSKAMSVVPQEVVRFDLEKAAKALGDSGYLITPSEVMIIASKGSVEITLYINGRLMIQPAESKELATQIAAGFYASIESAKDKAA